MNDETRLALLENQVEVNKTDIAKLKDDTNVLTEMAISIKSLTMQMTKLNDKVEVLQQKPTLLMSKFLIVVMTATVTTIVNVLVGGMLR